MHNIPCCNEYRQDNTNVKTDVNHSNPGIARKLGNISCDLLLASISKGITGIFMKKFPPDI
jgi:hypothetical protein